MDYNNGGRHPQHGAIRAQSHGPQPRADGSFDTQLYWSPGQQPRDRSFEAPQARALERAGLVGAWLDAALRNERIQLLEQLERQHAALVADLEAKLEVQPLEPAQGSTTPPENQLARLPVVAAANDGFTPIVSDVSKRTVAYGPGGNLTAAIIKRSVSKGGQSPGGPSTLSPSAQAAAVGLAISQGEVPSSKTGRTSKKGLSIVSIAENRPLTEQIFMRPKTMMALVEHPLFEAFFAVLIICNAAVMAFEVQYKGMDNGFILQYPGYSDTAANRWPGAVRFFETMEVIFGVWFTIEVIVKMAAEKLRFMCSAWNLFDTVIISFWLLDYTTGVELGLNPTVLRLARLAKVLRMVRVVKFMHALDALQLLISSIQASASILLWSTVILSLVMVTCAMIMNYLLVDYMTDLVIPELDGENRHAKDVYKYFGTFSRAMLTMVELTLQNPFPCCRMLVENVSEMYGLLFVVYKIVVGFAVVKVITGVFMHETFKVASTDDELMILQKERLIEKHTKKMHLLFQEADTTGEGSLSMEEFRSIMNDKRVKTWLGAMELDVRDSDLLFSLIDDPDDGNTTISAAELVAGVAKLKGGARSIDMAVMMREVTALHGYVETAMAAKNASSAATTMTAMPTAPEFNTADFAAVARETQGLREGLTALRRQMGDLLRCWEGAAPAGRRAGTAEQVQRSSPRSRQP